MFKERFISLGTSVFKTSRYLYFARGTISTRNASLRRSRLEFETIPMPVLRVRKARIAMENCILLFLMKLVFRTREGGSLLKVTAQLFLPDVR